MNLDIQNRIWIGAQTYSLTNMIISYEFGYPKLNMDIFTDILNDQPDHFLRIWISKFEYG
jgi:hypothetical protein